MNTFKRIQKVVREAKVDKGRSDYGKATIRNWRHSGSDTVEPAMFDPENKRGKTIDKRRAEHKARRGVKGAKVPVHGVKEEKVKNYGKKFSIPLPGPLKNIQIDAIGPEKDGGLSNNPIKGTLNRVGLSPTGKENLPKVAKAAKSVGKAALKGAAAVGAGLAVSKGVDSLMKMGKKKAVKEQNLDELKLFGKKGSGAIFYNDPKGRRDALKTTGKDPGVVNKPAVDNAVKNVKTNVTNKVKSVVTPVQKTVQKSIDTQTNRAGANIGNQISRKVKPAVSSGVSDGIKKGATAVGKAALKGTAAVGAGLAVSKGVDSLMKGGKKKEAKEGYSDWRSDEELMERVGGAGTLVRQGVKYGGKKGGRAVQKGQASALKAGQGAKAKAAQGNQTKMVGSGKYEKAGAIAGGVIGGVAGGVLDGPAPVGDIVGGIAGSKIGGKIGRQFDKRAQKKAITQKEDYYSGTGEKVQKRTLAWMRKKGMKGSPGLNAMKAREAEHKAKRGVKKEEVVNELKTSTLRSYDNRASVEAVGRGVDAGVKGMTGPKKEMEKNMTKAYKRQRGINRAVNKLASRAERNEEVELYERLGGKGYKPRKDYAGRTVSGDWPDSDRGAGNKATRRAGGKVEKKSPTYRAHVLNKEEVVNEIAPAIAAVGKMALKAGASAVKQKAKQVVAQKAANVAAGAIPQPNMNEGVVDIIKKGAKRHSKAIEKKKIKNRKAVPYAALGAGYEPEGNVIGEEGYDRMRDDRLVKYGIGHDGSDRKGSTYRSTGKQPKGKTVLQKETEKKYGKGVSALDVVKADIKAKYGKGSIYDGKKK